MAEEGVGDPEVQYWVKKRFFSSWPGGGITRLAQRFSCSWVSISHWSVRLVCCAAPFFGLTPIIFIRAAVTSSKQSLHCWHTLRMKGWREGPCPPTWDLDSCILHLSAVCIQFCPHCPWWSLDVLECSRKGGKYIGFQKTFSYLWMSSFWDL